MLTTTTSQQLTRNATLIAGLLIVVCSVMNVKADSELPRPSTLDLVSAATGEFTTVRANGCSGSCNCSAVHNANGQHQGSCQCSRSCNHCNGSCRRTGRMRGGRLTYRLGNAGCNSCGCRFRVLGGGGRLRSYVCRFGAGGGMVRNAPGCDMPGHSPYETWSVYYYYRPYQSMHVDEQLAGVAAGQYNSYSNEQFCDIHGAHAELVAVEHPITDWLPNNRRYLEFASCHEPLSTSSPADYRRPSVHLPELAPSPSRLEIRTAPDSRVPERDDEVEEMNELMPAPFNRNEFSSPSGSRIPVGSSRSSRRSILQTGFEIVDPATLRQR